MFYNSLGIAETLLGLFKRGATKETPRDVTQAEPEYPKGATFFAATAGSFDQIIAEKFESTGPSETPPKKLPVTPDEIRPLGL